MNKLYGHFMTITEHKLQVTKMCFKCGLYKQGFLHDLSKYSLIEFRSGVKYFQGNRSPIDREKECLGVSYGWLHHKGRNKHHWEYWMDNSSKGLSSVEMPVKYIVEMYCDRIVASRIYQKENYREDSAYNYFINGYSFIDMAPIGKKLLEDLLYYHKCNGEQKTIQYIKREVLKKNKT